MHSRVKTPAITTGDVAAAVRLVRPQLVRLGESITSAEKS